MGYIVVRPSIDRTISLTKRSYYGGGSVYYGGGFSKATILKGRGWIWEEQVALATGEAVPTPEPEGTRGRRVAADQGQPGGRKPGNKLPSLALLLPSDALRDHSETRGQSGLLIRGAA